MKLLYCYIHSGDAPPGIHDCSPALLRYRLLGEDGGGVRWPDCLSFHKHFKNLSKHGTTATEQLLNDSRRPQASKKTSRSPWNEKSNQHCKAIILQLKMNKLKKKEKYLVGNRKRKASTPPDLVVSPCHSKWRNPDRDVCPIRE